MAKIDLPYEITNLTPANAVPVQSNFARIQQHTNAELIERGGTVAMTAQLRLAGNPVAALDAAPKQYVDTIIPVGGILTFGGVAAPPGGIWLLCDGAPYETAVYPALYAVIGTRYGGSGGFFNVPPLTNRVPVGGGGKYAVGAQGGSADASVVAHTHPIDHQHGAAYTAQTDTNHIHNTNGQTGASDRQLWTSADGNHVHTVPKANSQGFVVSSSDASAGEAGIVVGGSGYVFSTHTSEAQPQLHSHTVSDHLHQFNLNTGWMDRNNPHNHWFQGPAHAGASGQTGVAAAETNMPPYVGVTFLIRAA
jgi:microcystin-dependent protein